MSERTVIAAAEMLADAALACIKTRYAANCANNLSVAYNRFMAAMQSERLTETMTPAPAAPESAEREGKATCEVLSQSILNLKCDLDKAVNHIIDVDARLAKLESPHPAAGSGEVNSQPPAPVVTPPLWAHSGGTPISKRDALAQPLAPPRERSYGLREALEFYAEPDNWGGKDFRVIIEIDLGMTDEPTPGGHRGTYMGGKRAREALDAARADGPTREEVANCIMVSLCPNAKWNEVGRVQEDWLRPADAVLALFGTKGGA